MKKNLPVISLLFAALFFIAISCDTKPDSSEQEKTIENTLKSVSFFKDTLNLEPQEILKAFTPVNEAIDEIGYPDAGYKIWKIQPDDSEIKYMVEGYWPSQDVYDEIHNNQLYKDAIEKSKSNWVGLVSLEYHRFEKMK